MRLKKILALINKRNDSTFENAGFIGGIVLGILIAVYELVGMLLYKKVLIAELQYTLSVIPEGTYNIELMYLFVEIVTPVVIVLIHMLIGVLFGSFITKKTNGNPLILFPVSVGIGILFGLITNSPFKRIVTVFSIAFFWLVFAFIQFFILKKSETGKKDEI